MNSVTVLSGARIGNNNTLFPGAVIGAIPQDLKFKGEETTAEIGDNNTIRENVTINRGTAAIGSPISTPTPDRPTTNLKIERSKHYGTY